jgi:hypothetical protein
MDAIAEFWRNRLCPDHVPVEAGYHYCTTDRKEQLPGAVEEEDDADEDPKYEMWRRMSPEMRRFKGIPDPPPKRAKQLVQPRANGNCEIVCVPAKIFREANVIRLG